jgi:UDP-N-acetylmuramoylalanine--D-glutamate ligase
MSIYQSKKALIIGLGISGRSAAKFLLKQGAQVLGVDQNKALLENDCDIQLLRSQGLSTAHESAELDPASFDFVVVSPGVSQNHPLYEWARNNGLEIIGEVELACRTLSQTILGITGTNGKTTVTLLIAHVLNANGQFALALGNVGKPITAELNHDSHKIIVAELSSFQLETMTSKSIQIGVVLNVTPDHLDRYHSLEDYARVKFSIKNCLKPQGELYVEEKTYEAYKHLLANIEIKTYGSSARCTLYTDKQNVYLNGKFQFTLPEDYKGKVTHDIENILAAYALCQTVGISGNQFYQSLMTFRKPSHRIEFVEKIRGVSYYNDSKGTNIDAVMRAVESVPQNIILIAGGVDKGSSYIPWIEAFAGKVKGICAIGQAATKIQKELNHALPTLIFSSLKEAVCQAAAIAKEGDSILLSPGCSSYDMFRDYAHRGNEFKKIIHDLKERNDD